MKRNRYLAVLMAALFILSQSAAPAYGAEAVNGSVVVTGDSASYIDTSGAQINLPRETGSITNTSGGTAVSILDQTSTEGGQESAAFRIDGDVNAGDATCDTTQGGWDFPVTSLEVQIQDLSDPDSGFYTVKDNEITITGGVTADGSIPEIGDITGVILLPTGGKNQDQSLILHIDGDVTATNSSSNVEKPRYTSGIYLDTDPDSDQTGAASTATMTTKVTAGSVTADGGVAGDVEGVGVYSRADASAQDVTVDINGNITARTQDGGPNGLNLGLYGYNSSYDNTVNVNVGGNISVEGTGYHAYGISVGTIYSEDGKASATVDVKGDIIVKSTDPENGAHGIYNSEDVGKGGDLSIHVGDNLSVEGVGDVSGVTAPSITGGGTSVVKIDGDITTTKTGDAGDNAAISTYADDGYSFSDVLVGGNATASGSAGTGVDMSYYIYDYDDETSSSGNPDVSQNVPRIEVLGTINGGENGTDLLIHVQDSDNRWDYELETEVPDGDPMTAEAVKNALMSQLPEIVTHELANGSIQADAFSQNADNEAAALEALKNRIFYTVNYQTKVTDEAGTEDDSLGTITITQYDGSDLKKMDLRYDGSSAYVAKAGDIIKIDIKVAKEASSENKEEVVTGTAAVTTEETDTEIITTTTTPVTTRTWTETTSYEIDLDKLQAAGGKGILTQEEPADAGEVIYTLEVTAAGGIDIDVTALIKAVTQQTDLNEVTENTVTVSKQDKPDVTPTNPDDNPSNPDVTPSTPDDNPTTPDDNPSTPDVTPSNPDDNPSNPDDNPSNPDVTPSTPDDSSSSGGTSGDTPSTPDDGSSSGGTSGDTPSTPDDSSSSGGTSGDSSSSGGSSSGGASGGSSTPSVITPSTGQTAIENYGLNSDGCIIDQNREIIKDQVVTLDDGRLVAADSNGQLILGNKIVTIGDKKYLIMEDGTIWTKGNATAPNGRRVYANPDGTLKIREIYETAYGNLYYYTINGYMKKADFVNLNGKKYYAGDNGRLKQGTGFAVGGKKYVAGKDGALLRNTTYLTIYGNTYDIGDDYIAVRREK